MELMRYSDSNKVHSIVYRRNSDSVEVLVALPRNSVDEYELIGGGIGVQRPQPYQCMDAAIRETEEETYGTIKIPREINGKKMTNIDSVPFMLSTHVWAFNVDYRIDIINAVLADAYSRLPAERCEHTNMHSIVLAATEPVERTCKLSKSSESLLRSVWPVIAKHFPEDFSLVI